MSFPRTNKFEYPLRVFDGGLNTKFSPPDVPINASPDCQNVQFTRQGSVETSYGYRKWQTAAIGSGTVDGLHPYADASSSLRLLAVCSGTVYMASGVSGETFTAISGTTGIHTAGVDVFMMTYKGYTWVHNGHARSYKYDGTTWSQAGVSAVTENLGAVASGATGDLNGEYRWVVTGINSANAESDYSILAATATIASGEVSLTGIPVYPASAGVNSKFLYRNTAGVSTVFYRVTALTAAQTAFTDTIADTGLSTNTAPTAGDNAVMPACKYVVEYGGMLFAAGVNGSPTSLRWSNQGFPEYWPATNELDVGEDDGMPITGLRVFANGIEIHKNDGRGNGVIFILYIADPINNAETANWYLTQSDSAYGGQGHKSLIKVDGNGVFLSRSGVYEFNSESVTAKTVQESNVGMFAVDSISYEIEPDILDCNTSALNKAAMALHDNRLYLAIPYGSTQETNNRIYMMDRLSVSSQGGQMRAWTKMSEPAVNNLVNYDGKIYGGSYDGYVYQLAVPDHYQYDGGAIDNYYWTAFIYGLDEHRDYTKVWRYLYVNVECTGDYRLDVGYRQDTEESGNTTTLNLNQPQSKWGTMIYGVDYWDVGFKRRIYRVVLRGMVSRMIQFKFAMNSADHWFRIYETKVAYTVKGQR